jgi:hypothetical protein
MNDQNGRDSDLEAATDQLVDEICQRLTSLYVLLDTSLATDGPNLHDIRTHASEVVRRLRGPSGDVAASLVARILWPPQPGRQVPGRWWGTPLGRLLEERGAIKEAKQRVPVAVDVPRCSETRDRSVMLR